MTRLDLDGQVYAVTGAAGGIGAAAARILAGSGARLALCDMDADRLAAVSATLPCGHGPESMLTRTCDVSDHAAAERFASDVVDRFGRVDALLHIAGVVEAATMFEVTRSSWERIIDINLWGTFATGKAFAEHMVRAGSGRIVLTASNAARAGSTTSSPAYAASKGGVIALTRTMARQLGPHGVTVNAISPGFTMTDMSFAWSDELIADMSRRTPLGRLAQPEDVARAAVALSTDLMGFVTGHVLDVNGGFRFD